MKRRWQEGNVYKESTAKGEVWYLRFTSLDGKRPRFRIGLVKDYPSKVQASRAAQPFREKFNAGDLTPKQTRTVGDLIKRYEDEEMPKRFSTACGYKKIHKVISSRWKDQDLLALAPLEVRAWLRDLTLKNGDPASSRTRGHVLVQFRNLIKYAMLWQWMPLGTNPLSLFSLEGATKRTRTPRVVSPEDFRNLLDYFTKPTRTRKEPDQLMLAMVLPAYCLGLRISELIGLKWQDLDYLGRTINIKRAVVRGREGNVKTERSEAPLPLAPQVIRAFLDWHRVAPFPEELDWVFGSAVKSGKGPIDARKLQSTRLREAGKAIGLGFPLGWHTFRHSYKSLLDSVTQDLTLKRDLMRHSDTHTTANVYGENVVERLRAANDAAVALALPERLN